MEDNVLQRDLEIAGDCKRCQGSGVAITTARRGPSHAWICSCPAGRSIPQPPRTVMRFESRA